jgi:hypothetical protein
MKYGCTGFGEKVINMHRANINSNAVRPYVIAPECTDHRRLHFRDCAVSVMVYMRQHRQTGQTSIAKFFNIRGTNHSEFLELPVRASVVNSGSSSHHVVVGGGVVEVLLTLIMPQPEQVHSSVKKFSFLSADFRQASKSSDR